MACLSCGLLGKLEPSRTIVAADLAIKHIFLRPELKTDVQPVVPIRQSPDRAFGRQWTVFDIAKKSDFRTRLPRSPWDASL